MTLLLVKKLPEGIVIVLITNEAKLLNADWLRQRALFLNHEKSSVTELLVIKRA